MWNNLSWCHVKGWKKFILNASSWGIFSYYKKELYLCELKTVITNVTLCQCMVKESAFLLTSEKPFSILALSDRY